MTEFSPAHRKITIIIASLGTSMGFIDATALNVALPFIQSSLNASATDIHWVLEIYLLFLAALMMAGLKKGEVVTIMCPNTPEMVEAHFGVAMAGGVLNTMNTRLDTDTISYILDHAETRFLLTDTAFSDQMAKALAQADNNQITVIDIIDKFDEESRDGARLGALDYEAFIATGSADYDWQMPEDEWDAMALNYTSGTSGNPKGVVYHHRGAYLMAMGTIPDWGLPRLDACLFCEI